VRNRRSAESHATHAAPEAKSLLVEVPGVEGGAPLAVLALEDVDPVTGQFLVPGVDLPAPVDVAAVAFAVAALDGDLVVLEAALDEAAEQLLGAGRPGDRLAARRQNDGILGVGFRQLRGVTRIEGGVSPGGRGRGLALEVLGESSAGGEHSGHDKEAPDRRFHRYLPS
jgi:hypothetical protein